MLTAAFAATASGRVSVAAIHAGGLVALTVIFRLLLWEEGQSGGLGSTA